MTDVVTSVISSPLFIFLLAIFVALIFYWLSGRISPLYLTKDGKGKAYTGGEDIPGKKYGVTYNFYHLALIFTVLHVIALVVATAMIGGSGIAAIVYLLIGVVAVIIILVGW